MNAHQHWASPFVSREVGTLAPTVELRSLAGRAVPYAGGRPVPGIERQPGRHVIDLAGTWRRLRAPVDHQLSLTERHASLALIEDEGQGRHQVGYDDSGWDANPLPSPENVLGPRVIGCSPIAESYEDGVWYRRTVRLTVPGRDERVRVVFVAVNYIADVWLNGRWVGYHEGGYSPFSLDVTDTLVDGENLIAVRVDNPPWNSRTDIVPSVTCDWWNYTGILQDVYLEKVPTTSIARVDVVPTAIGGDPSEQARLEVTVVVDQHDAVTRRPLVVRPRLSAAVVPQQLMGSSTPADLEGPPVSWWVTGPREVVVDEATGDGAVSFCGVVDQPRLWTPEAPNLHVLTVELLDGERVVDSYATQIGIRTLGVAAGSPTVLLNGRTIAFRGAARHEDWVDTGRTVASPQHVVDDLVDIRGTGVTLLRTGHYPNHPLTYLVADRIGLAVIEEIPTWWFDTYHFADQSCRGIGLQMWREMVFRDYNRPSVFFWSATNEAISVEHRAEFLHHVVHDLRRYDDGRLVTQSAAADRPGPGDPTQSQVDVAGWTTYFGVFHGDAGSEAELTEQFLRQAHAACPHQPMLVTEFGMWAQEDDALADRQREVFDRTWPVYERHLADRPDGCLTGSVWWAAYDWRTPIAGHNTFGLSHIRRQHHRSVRRSLEQAYLSPGPCATGPVLDARPPLLPRRPIIRCAPPADPHTLADFRSPDSTYPVHNAVVERVGTAAASGGWAARMTALGSWPCLGAYLYRRPVDLSDVSHLCVRVLTPTGAHGLRLRVRDTRHVEGEVSSFDPIPANCWTTVCVTPTRFTDVDLSRVERVHITMEISDCHTARGQQLYVDTVSTRDARPCTKPVEER